MWYNRKKGGAAVKTLLCLLLILGSLGAILFIAGIGYGQRGGFAKGSPGRRCFLSGLVLFFLGFGVPAVWFLFLR